MLKGQTVAYSIFLNKDKDAEIGDDGGSCEFKADGRKRNMAVSCVNRV